MTEDDDLNDAQFEQAASQLNQGLESCRSLVASYRAVLGSDAATDGAPAAAAWAANENGPAESALGETQREQLN